MAYHTTILSQILKLVPRLEFERLGNEHDGRRRSDALSRWSQFVALTIGQLAGRTSLRDIEATIESKSHHRYHLGSQSVSRSALGRANEQLDYGFYVALFQTLEKREKRGRYLFLIFLLWSTPVAMGSLIVPGGQMNGSIEGEDRNRLTYRWQLCWLVLVIPMNSSTRCS